MSISSRGIFVLFLICVLYVTAKNSLLNYGINCDASLSEMEWLITRSIPTSCIFSIRSELFPDAKESGLVAAGDALVTRRKTNGGKTVRGKHASDICQLLSSIKNKTVIPQLS